MKFYFFFKCRSLETSGYESFAVITSEEGHFQLGSKKGTKFIDSHFGLISEFVQYCRGNEHFLHMKYKQISRQNLPLPLMFPFTPYRGV